MEYIPLIIGVFVAILMVIIAIAIKYHQAYGLIAGYNTMSEENKKNVDIKNLGDFIAKVMFTISGIIFIATLLMFVKQMLAAGIVFALIVPLIIYTIIKAQTYDKNTRKPDGAAKAGTKVMIGAIVGFLVLVMAGVGTLLYFSNKPAEFFIQADTLKISGMYGEEIKLSDISDITIKDNLPEIQQRSNGSSIGSKKKGYFELKDIGQAKLFVDTQVPPFIFINVTTGLRIINTNEPAETEMLYEKLLETWRRR